MLFIQNKIYKYINPTKTKGIKLCKKYKIKNKFNLAFYKSKNKKEITKENKIAYVIYFSLRYKIGPVL
jgi:hypothetical protein